jgi:hypothetical protein
MLTRRGFLRGLTGGVVAAGVVLAAARTSLEAIAEMSQAGLDEPEFWRRVRGEFFLDKDWIYLNNGTLGPAPISAPPPTRCVARPPLFWARTSTRSRSCATPPRA